MSNDSNNVSFLKQCATDYRMTVALEQLEERGIPLTLFIGRLRDVPINCNKDLLLAIDHAIIMFGGKAAWLAFLHDASRFVPHVTIGAHSDF